MHFIGSVLHVSTTLLVSDMKYNAIVKTGIKIVNRIPIPKELIRDAHVEINAKVFAGYHAGKVYQGIDEKHWRRQWDVRVRMRTRRKQPCNIMVKVNM